MKWFNDKVRFDKWLMVILTIGVLLLLLTSCLGSKSVSEKSSVTKQTEFLEVKEDSSSVKETNKEIDDSISTKVQDTGDEVLDAKVDEILSKLNTQKSSGDNSYNLIYDRVKRELRAELKIGATTNVATDTNKSEKSEKTLTEQIDEYFKKRISTMPWYIWVGLFIFLWPTIWKFLKPIIQVISGPANIVTGVSNLIKPKK